MFCIAPTAAPRGEWRLPRSGPISRRMNPSHTGLSTSSASRQSGVERGHGGWRSAERYSKPPGGLDGLAPRVTCCKHMMVCGGRVDHRLALLRNRTRRSSVGDSLAGFERRRRE